MFTRKSIIVINSAHTEGVSVGCLLGEGVETLPILSKRGCEFCSPFLVDDGPLVTEEARTLDGDYLLVKWSLL